MTDRVQAPAEMQPALSRGGAALTPLVLQCRKGVVTARRHDAAVSLPAGPGRVSLACNTAKRPASQRPGAPVSGGRCFPLAALRVLHNARDVCDCVTHL